MILLYDTELLEAVSGSLGYVLFKILLFKNKILFIHIFEGFITWMLIWIFRKIINNVYEQKFKKKGYQLTDISI
tara:strand:- start:734 stop:955 length:222 start_codon:yes stop_codon:yes gene_type:complete